MDYILTMDKIHICGVILFSTIAGLAFMNESYAVLYADHIGIENSAINLLLVSACIITIHNIKHQ